MPSNTNVKKNAPADEQGNNLVKSIVFNPSEPMARAFLAECAKRESAVYGTTFEDTDNPLDMDFKKGIKADIVREALTQYLNAKGHTWEEPKDVGRSSEMFNLWRFGGSLDFEIAGVKPLAVSAHAQRSDESPADYKERYKVWYAETNAERSFQKRNYSELAVKRMEKIQSLVAMGTDQLEAFKQAFAAFPDGTEVAERTKKREKKNS